MIDFLKYRYICAIISLGIIGLFIGTYAYKKYTYGSAFTYSIDFTGGTQVLFKFEKPIALVDLKNILEHQGYNRAVLRQFSNNEILVRVPEFSNDAQGLATKMVASVQSDLPDNNVSILQNEAVGAGVGKELWWKSLQAILYALIAMLCYIAIRFRSFAFGMGAVVALAHDAIIMLGVFLLLDREISITVIGAILAVLGYSVNDTIVIFSQIRQNMKKMSGMPIDQIVDVSINQTLRRTILTSVSTMLTVLAMFIFGGEVLRDFSLALLIGIIFGTYSSIYIASPVMMAFLGKRDQKDIRRPAPISS